MTNNRRMRKFEGTCHIPGEQLAMMAKYYRGANLNLNLTLLEDDNSIMEQSLENSCWCSKLDEVDRMKLQHLKGNDWRIHHDHHLEGSRETDKSGANCCFISRKSSRGLGRTVDKVNKGTDTVSINEKTLAKLVHKDYGERTKGHDRQYGLQQASDDSSTFHDNKQMYPVTYSDERNYKAGGHRSINPHEYVDRRSMPESDQIECAVCRQHLCGVCKNPLYGWPCHCKCPVPNAGLCNECNPEVCEQTSEPDRDPNQINWTELMFLMLSSKLFNREGNTSCTGGDTKSRPASRRGAKTAVHSVTSSTSSSCNCKEVRKIYLYDCKSFTSLKSKRGDASTNQLETEKRNVSNEQTYYAEDASDSGETCECCKCNKHPKNRTNSQVKLNNHSKFNTKDTNSDIYDSGTSNNLIEAPSTGKTHQTNEVRKKSLHTKHFPTRDEMSKANKCSQYFQKHSTNELFRTPLPTTTKTVNIPDRGILISNYCRDGDALSDPKEMEELRKKVSDSNLDTSRVNLEDFMRCLPKIQSNLEELLIKISQQESIYDHSVPPTVPVSLPNFSQSKNTTNSAEETQLDRFKIAKDKLKTDLSEKKRNKNEQIDSLGEFHHPLERCEVDSKVPLLIPNQTTQSHLSYFSPQSASEGVDAENYSAHQPWWNHHRNRESHFFQHDYKNYNRTSMPQQSSVSLQNCGPYRNPSRQQSERNRIVPYLPNKIAKENKQSNTNPTNLFDNCRQKSLFSGANNFKNVTIKHPIKMPLEQNCEGKYSNNAHTKAEYLWLKNQSNLESAKKMRPSHNMLPSNNVIPHLGKQEVYANVGRIENNAPRNIKMTYSKVKENVKSNPENVCKSVDSFHENIYFEEPHIQFNDVRDSTSNVCYKTTHRKIFDDNNTHELLLPTIEENDNFEASMFFLDQLNSDYKSDASKHENQQNSNELTRMNVDRSNGPGKFTATVFEEPTGTDNQYSATPYRNFIHRDILNTRILMHDKVGNREALEQEIPNKRPEPNFTSDKMELKADMLTEEQDQIWINNSVLENCYLGSDELLESSEEKQNMDMGISNKYNACASVFPGNKEPPKFGMLKSQISDNHNHLTFHSDESILAVSKTVIRAHDNHNMILNGLQLLTLNPGMSEDAKYYTLIDQINSRSEIIEPSGEYIQPIMNTLHQSSTTTTNGTPSCQNVKLSDKRNKEFPCSAEGVKIPPITLNHSDNRAQQLRNESQNTHKKESRLKIETKSMQNQTEKSYINQTNGQVAKLRLAKDAMESVAKSVNQVIAGYDAPNTDVQRTVPVKSTSKQYQNVEDVIDSVVKVISSELAPKEASGGGRSPSIHSSTLKNQTLNSTNCQSRRDYFVLDSESSSSSAFTETLRQSLANETTSPNISVVLSSDERASTGSLVKRYHSKRPLRKRSWIAPPE